MHSSGIADNIAFLISITKVKKTVMTQFKLNLSRFIIVVLAVFTPYSYATESKHKMVPDQEISLDAVFRQYRTAMIAGELEADYSAYLTKKILKHQTNS